MRSDPKRIEQEENFISGKGKEGYYGSSIVILS
jgi:hypothetical protein